MKKFNVLLVGALAMLATSCGYKSEEKPLEGSLVTYTAEGAKDGEILLGVKDKSGKKDKTIIPADSYASITVDDTYFICTRNDASFAVFTRAGEPTEPKTFSTFAKQDIDGNTFYAGTAGENIYYFFPGKPAVSSTLSYMTAKNLLIQNATNWDIYTFDGTLVWSFPDEAILIKSARSEEYVVVVPEIKKKVTTYKVYDMTGKELKKLNVYQWKKFKKQLKDQQKLGATDLYELETIKIEKLTI